MIQGVYANCTVSDLSQAERSAAGIDSRESQPGGGARILQLADSDGNRVAFTGT